MRNLLLLSHAGVLLWRGSKSTEATVRYGIAPQNLSVVHIFVSFCERRTMNHICVAYLTNCYRLFVHPLSLIE